MLDIVKKFIDTLSVTLILFFIGIYVIYLINLLFQYIINVLTDNTVFLVLLLSAIWLLIRWKYFFKNENND